MGRVALTIGKFGSELDPLSREELKPLSGYEQITLSRFLMLRDGI